MISPSGQEIEDFKQLTKELDIPLCEISIGNRKDFFRAQNQGLAVQEYNIDCKASTEIIQLYKFICIQLYK